MKGKNEQTSTITRSKCLLGAHCGPGPGPPVASGRVWHSLPVLLSHGGVNVFLSEKVLHSHYYGELSAEHG